MEKDRLFLQKAIEIAKNGINIGGGPFGAVVAKDEKILAEAFNRVVLTNDPTAHAEILAIREAAKVLGSHNLAGCTIYSSCEPCPMCLGAIYWAGIERVVYGYERKDAEKAGFSDNVIYEEIKLDPANRKIPFIRMIDEGKKSVFKCWEEFENRKLY
jgi:tRNA(Arg) A34 adenosine deaminase TadA